MNSKYRNIIVIFGGIALIFFLTTLMRTEKHNQKEIEQEIETFHKTKDSTLQFVDDFVNSYNHKKEINSRELDSLNTILKNNKRLSEKEILELKRKINNKENVIREVSNNITEKDSIIYNIILKDTIICDTIFKTDTIIDKFYVKDTVYKIDTLFYRKDQIKKIKIKN